MKGKIFVKLNKVMETLNLSATQIKRLSEDNKVVRYRRKDDDTLSWEYDDESIYAYKQYLEEKARLDRKYNNTKYVIKRDKTHAEFDKSKITSAITKAFMDVYSETQNVSQMIEKVTDLSVNKLLRSGRAEYDITDIQSAVESALVDVEEYEVARAYTDYRLEHDIARRQQTSIDYQVERLFAKDDDIVNENANKDSDVYATLRDLKAGAVDKVIGLKSLPKDVADAHVAGILHWHDLDYSPATNEHNCGLPDLADMLKNGFSLGNADVETPKSIETAVAQASQILSSIASNQYGGTSYDRIDEVLAPYAEKSYYKHLQVAEEENIPNPKRYAKKMTRKNIKSAMQSLEYEINTLFTSNGQTPFCTLGFGMGTNWYEREIQIAILEQRINGLGKDHRTAIFPKLLMGIKPGVNKNPGDPNYDIKQLALKSVVKRMSPEILNYDNIVNITGSYKSAMGCRSFLNGLTAEDLKAQGKTEDYSSGRFNIGVVSLNLPRVALDSHGDKDVFWKLLDERLELVKKALLVRIETVKKALPKYNPTGFMYGGYGRLGASDDLDVLMKNNRASVSVGYVGLYEMTAVFYGDWQHDHDYDQDAYDFTYKVFEHMNHKAAAWKKEYGYAFSCYGTPGESLNSSFEERDHKLYPNVPFVTDHEFYTNSFHYFVERKPTPFEKMEFEAPFQALSTGGFISYVELPVMKDNLEAVEAIWDYSYDCGIGYMEINTAIDHCLECGFEGEYTGDEKGYHCPNCGNSNPETSDVTRRTCGYLGNPMKRPMKKGRQAEIIHRVKHVSGGLGMLSTGEEIQSDDVDKIKVRNL